MLSILRYYNSDYSKEELSILLNESVNGTTAYNLVETAKHLGFNAYGVRKKLNMIDEVLPIILHTKIKNFYHYIVLYKINKKYATIMDPSIGLKKIEINKLNEIYTDIAIILYPEKKLLEYKENDIKLFNYKMFYKKIIIIILLTLFTVILSLLFNSYLKFIIDLLNFKNLPQILNITLLFLLIIFIKLLLLLIKNKIIIKLDVFLDKYISIKFIEHIFKISYLYFKAKQNGEVISIFDDVKRIKNGIILFVCEVTFNFLLVIFALILCYFLDLSLFYIMLVIIIVNILFSLQMYFSYKKKGKIIIEEEAYFNSYFNECISNIESIKNLNIINKISKKTKGLYQNNINNIKKFYNKMNFNTSTKLFINDLCYIIIVFIMAYLVLTKNSTIGELVYISIIFSIIMNSINTMYLILPEISSFSNSLYRIKEILKYKTINTLDNKTKIKGDIIVRNVSISYNKLDYIAKNLSFKINYRSFTLIIGKTGSGKSSFIKVLKKYIPFYDGIIYIGKTSLEKLDYMTLSNNILYVSQNERLFADTIEGNIKINNDDNAKYNKVLKLTYTDIIITNKVLKDKYFIEENALNVSGGERQRIILARALMNDFEYLVLDEALSEVDLNVEKDILKNLKEHYKNKTIIYISHNTKIKDMFDNIIEF